MAIWGTNFVFSKIALEHLPPLFMAGLRFAFAFFPAALFIARPAVSWQKLALYGVAIGAGQFGLIFFAMHGFISPGLTSLVVQVQIFFTIGMAMVIRGETVNPYQWLALALATLGLGVIMAHTGGDVTVIGVLLIVTAGFSWAIGNTVTASISGINMLSFVVWSSIFAVPPLLFFSLLVEGLPAMQRGLVEADVVTWTIMVWQVVGNTLFGYGAWAWLMSRYPAATVSPMALLVPVFGIGASTLLLNESLPVWKLEAGALVLAGLALNFLSTRRKA